MSEGLVHELHERVIEARALAGDIDQHGDVVDLHRRERLRSAISTDGPEPAEHQLRRVVALTDGRGS